MLRAVCISAGRWLCQAPGESSRQTAQPRKWLACLVF